jgi:uncharacterized protein
VKLVDANVLIYAINSDAPLHEHARRWLEGALSGREPVGIAWTVLLAFLRITTRRGIFGRPLGADDAIAYVDGWIEQPPVELVAPGPNHWAIFRALIKASGTAGNLTSDAHLAALAIEHGAEICTLDADFARFPALNWRNPLA